MKNTNNHYAILRARKLKTLGAISGSAQHTFRERRTLNANPAWGQNTTSGPDNSDALISSILARIEAADKKAPNPVLAIEYLITATPEAMRDEAKADAYLIDALDWLRHRHGRENVISSTIHRDEATCSHMVAYVVPLVHRAARRRKRSVIVGKNADGTRRRETREYETPACTVLSAAHFLDGRKKLSQMQTDFATKVGKPHGLVRGVKGSIRRHQRVKRGYAQELERPPRAHNSLTLPVPSARERLAPARYAEKQQAVLDEYRQESERERERLWRRILLQRRQIETHAAEKYALQQARRQYEDKVSALQMENNFLTAELQAARARERQHEKNVFALLGKVLGFLRAGDLRGAIELIVDARRIYATAISRLKKIAEAKPEVGQRTGS